MPATIAPYQLCTIPFPAESFDEAQRILHWLINDGLIVETRGDRISLASHPEEGGGLTYYVAIQTGNITGMVADLTEKGWL